jgi:hypothetical protein
MMGYKAYRNTGRPCTSVQIDWNAVNTGVSIGAGLVTIGTAAVAVAHYFATK